MLIEVSQETIEKLLKTARKESWVDLITEDEGGNIDDYAGGNIDDAFWGGVDHGEISYARKMLTALNIEWR